MTSFHQRQHGARNAIGRGLERLGTSQACPGSRTVVPPPPSLPPSSPAPELTSNIARVVYSRIYTRSPFDHHRLTTTDSRDTDTDTDALTHQHTEPLRHTEAHRDTQTHLSSIAFSSFLFFSLFYFLLFSSLLLSCYVVSSTYAPLFLRLFRVARVLRVSRLSAARDTHRRPRLESASVRSFFHVISERPLTEGSRVRAPHDRDSFTAGNRRDSKSKTVCAPRRVALPPPLFLQRTSPSRPNRPEAPSRAASPRLVTDRVQSCLLVFRRAASRCFDNATESSYFS